MYRLLAKMVVRAFFRRIRVTGTPHAGGASLWAPNHNSAIVDPIVMVGLAPVVVRPLAKHTLWDHPAMNPLLRWTKAIPIKRIQDMKADVSARKQALEEGASERDWRANSNNDAFKSISEALIEGGNVLIFPEGVSHDDPYIKKMKTGVARMALQAMAHAKTPGFEVVIQPVAIDYAEKQEFRSDLSVHFCHPVRVSSAEMEVADIMQGLMESLSAGLATFLDWSEKRNWQFLFELAYERPFSSASEFRSFVERHRPVFDSDPVLMARIQTMRTMTLASGVGVEHLAWAERHSRKRSFFFLVLRLAWLHFFLVAPVKLATGLVWYWPARICARLAKQETDFELTATMKIAHAAWLFPLWGFSGAGLASLLLASVLPGFRFWACFGLMAVLGPAFLWLGVLVTEDYRGFKGYWQLAKLRFLFPRALDEMVGEWREIAGGVAARLGSDGNQTARRDLPAAALGYKKSS